MKTEKNVCPHCGESLDKEEEKQIPFTVLVREPFPNQYSGYQMGGIIHDVLLIARNGKVMKGDLATFVDEKGSVFRGMAITMNGRGLSVTPDRSDDPKSMMSILSNSLGGVRRGHYSHVCMANNLHEFEGSITTSEQAEEFIDYNTSKYGGLKRKVEKIGAKVGGECSFTIRKPTEKETEVVPEAILTLVFAHAKVPLTEVTEKIFRSMLNKAWFYGVKEQK